MNDNIRRPLTGVSLDGSDSFLSDKATSAQSTSPSLHTIIVATSARIFRRKIAPLTAGALLMGTLQAAPVDITSDVINSRVENDVHGLKYNASTELGTINAKIQGTADTSHRGYGIWSTSGSITINEITSTGVIAGEAGRNYAYGLYAESGDITVTKSIAGTITATVNVSNTGASAYGYGIYAKSGNITLGGLSQTGVISVKTPQSTSGGRLYGIYTQSNGDIKITGPVSGKIEVLSKGNTAYGIWSQTGGVTIDSFTSTSSLTVTATFNSYGIRSFKDIVIGDINGTIDSHAFNGNYAYGIHAATLNSIDKANITLGNIGGTITAKSEGEYGGQGAYAVFAEYGELTAGNISGDIIAESTTNKAMAISAADDVTIGDIEEGAVISAKSVENAYAIFPANNMSRTSWDSAYMRQLTIGDIHGTVSAHATTGEVIAMVSHDDLSIGEIGSTAIISATSDGSASARAVWASFGHLDADNINGTIIAQSVSGNALGVGGFSLNVNIGPDASITAESDSGIAYALFSGAFQGGNYCAYNQPDSINIEAGAQITGIIEIGGSGANESDTFTLSGGSEDNMGVLNAPIQATVNTSTQQPSDSQNTVVDLTVGDENGTSAGWVINNQSGIFDNITIHQNAIVSSDDDSLSVKSGGTFQNYGKIIGSATIHIDAATGLTTGHLTQNFSTGELVVGSTGFGENVTLTIDSGATLGTSIANDTDGLFIIKQEDIESRAHDLFASLVGSSYNPADYTLVYDMQGNIAFTDKLVVHDGQRFIIGKGTNVVMEQGILPEDSLTLNGGTIDVSTMTDTEFSNKQVNGTSGTLIASSSQTMHMDESGKSGFDIQAGTITVGRNGGEFSLTGNYQADTIQLGTADISLEKGAILGVTSSDITLSTGGTLVNNATINGSLTGEDSVTIKGSGTFMQTVTLGSNSSLVIGNSPGQQVYNKTLTLGSGSTLTFSIEGTSPAAIGQDNTETYSNIIVSGTGSTITLGGSNTIILNIGSGILSNTSAELGLTLVKYTNGAAEDSSFDESNFTTTLTGNSDLIDSSTISYTHTGTELILNASINTTLFENALSPIAISYANALWSSTGMVHGYMKKAEVYMNAAEAGKTSIWASGIGDFMSYSSEGDRPGFDFSGGGYAFGIARGWNEQWSTGASFAYSTGTNEPDSSVANIDQDALMFSLHSRYAQKMSDKDTLLLDFSLAYGSVENKVREVAADGKWDDDVYSLSLTGKWQHKLDENNFLIPFIGLQYLDGAQDNITMTYDTGTRNYSGADLRRLILPIGITWQSIHTIGKHTLIPEVTIAYEADLSRTDPEVSTSLFGKRTVFRGVSPARSAVSADAGLRWLFRPDWSVSAAYHIEYASGKTAQAVDAGLVYTF